jgi:hypothetical protein
MNEKGNYTVKVIKKEGKRWREERGKLERRREKVMVRVRTMSRHSDWLRAGRPRGRSSSPGRAKNFLHVVHTGSEVHPTSYPMDTGGKAAGT